MQLDKAQQADTINEAVVILIAGTLIIVEDLLQIIGLPLPKEKVPQLEEVKDINTYTIVTPTKEEMNIKRLQIERYL